MHDIRMKMAKGAAWMIFFRGATRLLGLISTIILARLLVPEDFGLVAVATAIIAGLEFMTAFSFDIALIQDRDCPRSHYDTAWTITVLFAIATAVALGFLAVPAANFYEDARLEAILYVLAVGTVFEGFQNIGVVAFRKELDFRREFFFMVGKKLISFLTTVPLAFLWRNYWALVAGVLAGKIGGTVLSFLAHPFRPRFAMAAGPQLFHFSKWLVLNNLLGFLRHRAPDFIIGKVAGPGPLGLFALSYELSQLPTTELVAPINRAVYPAYARIADDLGALQRSYLEVVAMIAVIALPMAAGIATLAEPVVRLVLGAAWLGTVPLIQILGVTGAIGALETNIGSVYLALGKPALLSRLFGFFVAVLVILVLIFTSLWGVVGTAWGCLLATILNVPIYYGTMMRTLRMSAWQIVSVLWRPMIAATIMGGCVAMFSRQMAATWPASPDVIKVLAGVLTGVVVYALVLGLLWLSAGRPRDSAEAFLLRRVADFWRGWSAPPASAG
jgi:O-antigen/teichoic acid export membrane protein